MVNIKKAATQLLKELKGQGFNGVNVTPTTECTEEWNENYAIFILECETEIFGESENDYVRFDLDRFYADLKQYLIKTFGDDVNIKHYPACSEWEIIKK